MRYAAESLRINSLPAGTGGRRHPKTTSDVIQSRAHSQGKKSGRVSGWLFRLSGWLFDVFKEVYVWIVGNYGLLHYLPQVL